MKIFLFIPIGDRRNQYTDLKIMRGWGTLPLCNILLSVTYFFICHNFMFLPLKFYFLAVPSNKLKWSTTYSFHLEDKYDVNFVHDSVMILKTLKIFYLFFPDNMCNYCTDLQIMRGALCNPVSLVCYWFFVFVFIILFISCNTVGQSRTFDKVIVSWKENCIGQ